MRKRDTFNIIKFTTSKRECVIDIKRSFKTSGSYQSIQVQVVESSPTLLDVPKYALYKHTVVNTVFFVKSAKACVANTSSLSAVWA